MDGIEKFTLTVVAMFIGFLVLMGSFHAGFLVGKYKTQAELLNNEAQTISEINNEVQTISEINNEVQTISEINKQEENQ